MLFQIRISIFMCSSENRLEEEILETNITSITHYNLNCGFP